jgi:hypothetical protein
MKKNITWLVLAASVLWLAACMKRSEAKINVYNKGTLQVYVNLDYAAATISPGQTETFSLDWPGTGNYSVLMTSYPVGQYARATSQLLTMHNGDNITINVEFYSN